MKLLNVARKMKQHNVKRSKKIKFKLVNFMLILMNWKSKTKFKHISSTSRKDTSAIKNNILNNLKMLYNINKCVAKLKMTKYKTSNNILMKK